jgi:hypothetical protein
MQAMTDTDLVERLRDPYIVLTSMVVRLEAADEIELLRGVLQALHDWYVEYARINNLFNDEGSPATFHELLEARAALGKP